MTGFGKTCIAHMFDFISFKDSERTNVQIQNLHAAMIEEW